MTGLVLKVSGLFFATFLQVTSKMSMKFGDFCYGTNVNVTVMLQNSQKP